MDELNLTSAEASSSVSLVTKTYIDDLNKYGTEPFDQFEEQLVLAIKKLVK